MEAAVVLDGSGESSPRRAAGTEDGRREKAEYDRERGTLSGKRGRFRVAVV